MGEITREILPKVIDSRLLLSFTSKFLNKLIGKRDYSAQEVYYILLGLPLYEDSRIVLTVDYRSKAE